MATRWLVTTPRGIVGLFKTETAASKWLETGTKLALTRKSKEDSVGKREFVEVYENTPVSITEIEYDE